MKINYENKIIPVEDQNYLESILAKINGIDDLNKKIILEKELYTDVKERYGIPKDNCISILEDKELGGKIVVYDFGNKSSARVNP